MSLTKAQYEDKLTISLERPLFSFSVGLPTRYTRIGGGSHHVIDMQATIVKSEYLD